MVRTWYGTHLPTGHPHHPNDPPVAATATQNRSEPPLRPAHRIAVGATEHHRRSRRGGGATGDGWGARRHIEEAQCGVHDPVVIDCGIDSPLKSLRCDRGWPALCREGPMQRWSTLAASLLASRSLLALPPQLTTTMEASRVVGSMRCRSEGERGMGGGRVQHDPAARRWEVGEGAARWRETGVVALDGEKT